MILAALVDPEASLDVWWQRRGYENPFSALQAEDATLKQLEDWYITCPWSHDLPPRESDTLGAVISPRDSRIVLVFAPPGGGKTAYRRLAAYLCRDGDSRGSLEISARDLNAKGLSGASPFTAARIAICVYDCLIANCSKAASLPGQRPAEEGTGVSTQEAKAITDCLRSRLRQDLIEHFNDDELRSLCSDMGIDYENLPAQTKAGKARELIAYLERVGRTTTLIEQCQKLRPEISWEDSPAASGMTPHFPPAVALEHSRVGQILAQCGEVAATIHTERDPAKYYVFIDDLDRIGGTSRRHNDAVIRAITDFIDAVASRAAGECLAIRIFLSDDLYEPLKRALGHLWGEPILLVRLTWTVERCMEVVERRLEKAWQDTPRPNDQRHLPLLLDQDAIGMFGRQLETSQKQGHLSPRLAVRALSTAVDTVVQDEELRERIGAGRISGDVYASSQELLLRPQSPSAKRLLRYVRAFALPLLFVVGAAVGLWFHPQLRKSSKTFLSLVAHTVIRLVQQIADFLIRMIQWLAGVFDTIEAFIVLVVFAGAIVLVGWCLITSHRSDQKPDLRRCVRVAWEFARQHLPGGSR